MMMKNPVSFLFYLLMLACNIGKAQVADSTAAPVYYPEDSSMVRITRLQLNSKEGDLAPLLVGKKLYFVSGRPNDLAVTYDNVLKDEITDLFEVSLRDSLHFSAPRSLPGQVNTAYNEGPLTLSANGNTLYFSGNARERRSSHEQARLQVYRAGLNGGKWEKPVRAEFCDDGWSSFHPTLSPDNQLLVFASDRPGGYGGADLYSTRWVNGKWDQPVNLGPLVNTAGNELFPFLSADGQLYFSSNKAGGAGGLDLYRIPMNALASAAPQHLPAPINGPADDFGLCVDSTGCSGYFTSNRIAGQGDDIYYFYRYPEFSEAKAPPVKTKFCYTFFEAGEYQDTDSVSMTYEWDFGNGQKLRGARVKYCFNRPGDYPVQLNIVEKNSGLVFQNKVSYTLSVEPPPGIAVTCADTLSVGSLLELSAEHCRLKGYTLQEFYWSFGDGSYNHGKWVKHQYRRAGAYRITLGVIAKNEETKKIEKFRVEKNIIIRDTI